MPTNSAPTWEETDPIEAAAPTWEETTSPDEGRLPGSRIAEPQAAPLVPIRATPTGMPSEFSSGQGMFARGPENPDYAMLTSAAPAIVRAGQVISTPLIQPKTSAADIEFRKRHPIVGGIEQGIVDLAAGFTSPIGIATLGIGALPRTAQRAVSLAFAAQMAQSTPEIASELGTEFGKPEHQRDKQKIAKLMTDAIGTGAFTYLAARHGLGIEKPAGGPNASQEQETAKVYGDVRPQPGQGEGQVPIAQSGGGIQPPSGGAQAEVVPPRELQPISPAGTAIIPSPAEPAPPVPRVDIAPDLTGTGIKVIPPEPKAPNPDWQVTVQSPQLMPDKVTQSPGYVQIDEITNGQNVWSSDPQRLRAQGYDIPDFSKLPQGKYTLDQAKKLLEKGPEPAAPDEPPPTETPEDLQKQLAEATGEEGPTPEEIAAWRKKNEEDQQRIDKFISDNLESAGDTGGVELQSADNAQKRILVTPDIAEPGKWRITYVDERGPSGHNVFDDRETAIRAASGEGFSDKVKGPRYVANEYKVIRTSTPTKAPPSPVAPPPEGTLIDVPKGPKGLAGQRQQIVRMLETLETENPRTGRLETNDPQRVKSLRAKLAQIEKQLLPAGTPTSPPKRELPAPPAGIKVSPEQWNDMASLNDPDQMKKYGTTRTKLLAEAILSKPPPARPPTKSEARRIENAAKLQRGEPIEPAPEVAPPPPVSATPDLADMREKYSLWSGALARMEKREADLVEKRGKIEGYGQDFQDINADIEQVRRNVSRLKNVVQSLGGDIGLARFRAREGMPQQDVVPRGTQNITNKVLKTQKANLLDQLDAEIAEAPEQSTDKITISVPGDGEFTISNTKDGLKRFREQAEAQFPETVGGVKEPKLATTRAKSIPKVSEPTPAEVAKTVGEFTSEDKSRFVLQRSYSDGTQIIGTDGRQLIRVARNDLPGTPDAPVRLTPEGKVDTKAEGRFPNWKMVADPKAELIYGGMDTAEALHIIRQAKVFRDTSETDRTKRGTYSVKILVNPDRTLGAQMDVKGDTFEHNVQPNAINLGSYNPDYLENALLAARKLGNEKVDVYAHSGNGGPIGFVGKNHESLTMPMRISDKEGLREESPKFANVVGRAEHGRLPEGYGPLQNPLDLISESSGFGDGNYTTKLEGDTLSFEKVTERKGYGGRGGSTDRDPIGEIKVSEFPEDKAARRIVISDLVKKFQGEKNAQNKGLANALSRDAEMVINQRREIEKEVAQRKLAAGGTGAPDVTKPGPGAQTVGEPKEPEIRQLTQAVQSLANSSPSSGEMTTAFDLGTNLEGLKDTVSQAASGLTSAGKYLLTKLANRPVWNDWKAALGDWHLSLSEGASLVKRWVDTSRKAVPDKRIQAAISNVIDTGGDPAVLEMAENETAPRYKESYAIARRLVEPQNIDPRTGPTAAQRAIAEHLTMADNVRNYFEARGQQAIDAGVLEDLLENYIRRIYESESPWKQGVIAELRSGIFTGKPGLAKKRVFQYDYEAEKAGLKPIKSVVDRVAAYDLALNKAIADRKLVKNLFQLKEADGEPMIATSGAGVPVEPGGSDTLLVRASANGAMTADGRPYVAYDHPALRRWKWVNTDESGKTTLIQGNALVHPDALSRINALLGRSKVRQYALGRAALGVSSTIKQTMLDLSGFHPVQIGVHGWEHRTFKPIKEINFDDPDTRGLIRGGLVVGDTTGHQAFSEGLTGSSLTRHIPVLGPKLQEISEWLFGSYIPRLKVATGLHALERNRDSFPNLSKDELYHMTATQMNNAFGELNYAMLGRSKTTQDIMRLGLLAPDFLEARARFAGQGVTWYGREQTKALLFGAVGLYVAARLINKLTTGEWRFEPKNAFSWVYGGRAYSLRTVQGDLLHAATDPGKFIFNRLNPVYGRTAMEFLTKRDAFGRTVSYPEILRDTAKTIIPISLRGLFSGNEQKFWESLLNGFGVTERRSTATDTAFQLAQNWKQKNKIVEPGEFIYDPEKDPYRGVKLALAFGTPQDAAQEATLALRKGKTDWKRMSEFLQKYGTRPFTNSRENDKKFLNSLSGDQRKIVADAVKERQKIHANAREAIALYHRQLAAENPEPAQRPTANPINE